MRSGKRRAELITAGDAAAQQRGILGEYTAQFIDALIMSTATLAIFTYALYAIDLGDTGANVPTDNTMMVTIPFVAYGIYRYLYLLYVKGEGKRPRSFCCEIVRHSSMGSCGSPSLQRYCWYTLLVPRTAVDASQGGTGMSKLSEGEVAELLSGLADWELDSDSGAIVRNLEFPTFADAIQWRESHRSRRR